MHVGNAQAGAVVVGTHGAAALEEQGQKKLEVVHGDSAVAAVVVHDAAVL